MNPRWLVTMLLGVLMPVGGQAESPVVISEFMASNTHTLRDADGDPADWIELENRSSQPVALGGWRLTDDPRHRTVWTLPATNLPPGGFLLVFASGKDRAVAGRELHAGFRLADEGEYLALLAPDGSVASAHSPAYPPQLPDVAFGVGRRVEAAVLVPVTSPARAFVPRNDSLGTNWTGALVNEPFDDSNSAGWLAGPGGVGFDAATGPDPNGPMGFWDFNSAANASRAEDAGGHGHAGTVIGATYTPDGGGFSGRPGDRALNFGNGTGRVRIPAAANGVFDSATRSNALTISLWVYGGAGQPAQTSAFWITENADGSGARAAQAHLPWSDTVIYWDTGNGGDCCSPAGRISKAEPDATKWKGRWNHWVFLKRGPEKEIWQNGQLFHRGNGAYPLTTLRNVTIGALQDGSGGYIGLIDDFAMWDRALDETEIQALAAGASPLALAGYGSLVGTDVGAVMRGVNGSAYIRMPFPVAAPPAFDSLQLRVQYDAGFIAYLNGVEVARRNAGGSAWNALATTNRPRSAVRRFEEIDLPGAATLLRPGVNVLAFHGLNESATDDSFLLRSELVGLRLTPGRFLPVATPGEPNAGGVLGFVSAPTLSVGHGFFTNQFEVELRGTTPGASLSYTTNGSLPGPTNGTVIVPTTRDGLAAATVMVRTTMALRVASFAPEFQPSPAVAQTYLFAADVARQPVRPAGLPGTWADGATADYQVDPDVVTRTLPGYGFTEALLALPTLSLVADPRDLWDRSSGIYANSTVRGDAWERPASAELLTTNGAGFQINCGMRIHGNVSRQNDFTTKHSFRLVFRRSYGPTDLEYPLFGDDGVQRFDEVVLKGLSTDTWPCVEWGPNGEGFVRWYRKDATYIRDQWVRDAFNDMGQTGCRGRFVHLFLNGLYWGVYNLTEHPSASFQAANYGGDKDDYDVFKDFAELDNGTRDAWNAMMTTLASGLGTETAYQRVEGRNADGSRNPALPWHLNVDNLIDYMILHIAIGADDWPNHNWWAARRRGDAGEGFRFFPWDQEISISSLQRTRTSWGPLYEEVDAPETPAFPYARLRGNANFRLRFADRVHRHFFHGGALTPAANEARWQARVDELDRAIVAESARWGDARRSEPYRREVEWLAANRWMREQFWPQNHQIALNRFKRAGLYPSLAAPALTRAGGVIQPGFELTITAPGGGTIYYTLDGSDPRRPTGGVAPGARSEPASPGRITLPINDSVRLRARAHSGTSWSALTEAVFTVPLPLTVTELMFHPPPQSADELIRAGGQVFEDEAYEFIELQNLSASRVLNLAGARFTSGVRFTFGDVTLAPLERIVVVRNRLAFANRYGGDIRVAGEYGNTMTPDLDSQLSNGGEELELLDALGTTVFRFAYADDWYPATDGAGAALQLLDPTAGLNVAAAWQAGAVVGGTPGSSSTQVMTFQRAEVVAEGLRLTFDRIPGQLLSVEQTPSLTLAAWRSVHLEPMRAEPATITVTVPVDEAAAGFFRLVAP